MYPKNSFTSQELKFSFLKELSEKKKSLGKKEITSHTESKEISEIISERLLKSIRKQLSA